MAVELVEYTDPGCSWAWGTEPKLRLLRWRYGDRVRWRRVMGGLVGDMENYVKGFDPYHDPAKRAQYWKVVADVTGMTYPARLQYEYRSTEPACIAVKAAERQGEDVALKVLRRLRESCFVFGTPADTDERILESVRGVPGLDPARLAEDMHADPVQSSFQDNWKETREPNDVVLALEPGPPGGARETEGHWRYVFPTVIVRSGSKEITVPGWRAYEEYEDALVSVGAGGDADARPTVDEAFATWPSLAPAELAFLCGDDAQPPGGVVAYDWGDGVFYLTRPEAEARGVE
jgi:protein-disulfide isomerase-like protein with CxxC motif